MASLLTRGNAWGMISDRAGAGLLPAQVDLLDPDRVAVEEHPDRPPVIRVGGQEVDRADLWHVKAYPVAGSILGMSPIAYAREAIGLGIAAERFGALFFGDGATPQGALTTDQRINAEQAEELKARWETRHGGRRRIAVLGDGAKFQPITISPEESQFIETQRFNVSTICRIYGIAPEMMGGETAGHEAYTSPEMRGTDFLTFTLRPWLTRIEHAISTLLPRTQRAKFNAGGFVRATLRDAVRGPRLGIEAGLLARQRGPGAGGPTAHPRIDDQPPPEPGGAVA